MSEPCRCLTSWASVSPTHDGHCCFVPDTQTCHQREVAEWEKRRAASPGRAAGTEEAGDGAHG